MKLEERFGAHNYHPLDAVIKREGRDLYGISQHAVIDRDDLRRGLEVVKSVLENYYVDAHAEREFAVAVIGEGAA
jgi:hypothetical protein